MIRKEKGGGNQTDQWPGLEITQSSGNGCSRWQGRQRGKLEEKKKGVPEFDVLKALMHVERLRQV